MSRFLRRVATVFSERYKLKPQRNCMGNDLDGNLYYLIPAQKYFFGWKYIAKDQRIVEPPIDIGTRSALKVTPEWDSWLRKRRDDPPTLQELEINIQKSNLIQERVQKLEEKNRAEKIKQEIPKRNENAKQEQSDVESWDSKS